MKRVLITLVLASVMTFVGLAVVVRLGWLGRTETLTSTPTANEAANSDAYALSIAVEVDGTVEHATVRCLGEVRGDGYLAGNAAGNACITAMTSVGGVEILEAGYRDKPLPCQELVEARGESELSRPVVHARIWGTYENRRVRLDLDAAEPCHHAALWTLEPLLTPMDEPRLIQWDS